MADDVAIRLSIRGRREAARDLKATDPTFERGDAFPDRFPEHF